MAKQTPPEPKTRPDPAEAIEEQVMSSEGSACSTANSIAGVEKESSKPSRTTNATKTSLSSERPSATSPSTRKRALPEPSDKDEPSTKKSRDPPPPSSSMNGESRAPRFPSPPDCPATKLDKETWQGFCDIESEPAYFSVILREMGVQGVTVREVFAMDPALLETLPQPIHGLILLFHYREFGNEDQATECPANVWFANQLPAQSSCATLAMINILMNSTDVAIGDHLDQFKDFTRDFTPYQRGEALASFDFVKKIHNSFAKKMDILESDKHLSYKVHKARRLKREHMDKKNTKKSSKSRRASADSAATDDSAEGHEENAHHYIAFLPVGNEVWKLDGLDAQPTSMGTFDSASGATWLSAVSDTIAALMAAGDDDYGVIALTQAPLLSLRKRACLAINTMRHVDARLDTVDAAWHAFITADDDEPPSPRMLGIEAQLPAHTVPATLAAKIDAELMPDLLDRRTRLVKESAHLAAGIMTEIQSEAEEDQKAAQRRHDCGPVIKKWLEMLAENGHLAENLERFMPAGRKAGK